jgi:SHS family sialic acid transporter-like MFS transporter
MGTDDEPGAGRGKWLALTAALLGWLFDGAEMGVFSLVGRPAIKDLLGTTDEGVIGLWFGVVTAGFLVGAATGGVLFGWLGDRVGRVRAMTLSVLTYSLFTGLCGLAGQAWQVGALRFVAALGMGGEWSLGVALVMEVWPNRSRAFMAGLIGAAGNVGYMLVGFIGLGLAAILGGAREKLTAAGLAPDTADWFVRNQGWRLMMMVGTLPALLTFLIRLFVPESKKWQEEKGRGHTSGWATRDLLGVVVGAAGPALMIYLWAWDEPRGLHTLPVRLAGSVLGLGVAAAGYTYPLVRYLQRQAPADAADAWRPTLRRMLLAACLSGVALLGTWCSVQWAPSWADKLAGQAPGAKEYTQIALAIGAILGTILAAFMGDWFGRRPAYALLCLLSLGSVFLLFQTNTAYGTGLLLSAVFAGGATASFYGWLPLYLPELFPTRVRATGQGFGFNFGRILAAVGALQTGNLMGLFQQDVTVGGMTFTHGYPLACTAMSLIYLVGVAIIWLAPETRGKALPE